MHNAWEVGIAGKGTTSFSDTESPPNNNKKKTGDEVTIEKVND